MDKEKKTSTDNQWSSLPEEPFDPSNIGNKKEKSATDNQWTSTIKNSTCNK